ncbi:MAG: hypothetical protein Q9162_006999 [Coniocarpon cinnabarinum]
MDLSQGEAEDEHPQKREATHVLEGSISPPPLKRCAINATDTSCAGNESPNSSTPSPFRLNRIQDLPASVNRDTVSLADVIGDPLIRECWIFDYLFDVEWLFTWFDADVRDMIQVKIVHGSWRKDDPNKLAIDEAASKRANVDVITAYMPEAFGTHHSKMIVLFPRDWTNMTQGIWSSPRLSATPAGGGDPKHPIGSGERFKYDLLRYLAFYGDRRTGALTRQLERYDFSVIHAAFISSVPCRLSLSATTEPQTLYGWPLLRHILRQCPRSSKSHSAMIVAQVSSIAYLGEEWIHHFFKTLSTCDPLHPVAMNTKHYIMFPTTEEIRTSLDGYRAGASIHMRVQSDQAKRQLAFLRRYLVKWSDPGDQGDGALNQPTANGRGRAAPHVKTYIRYSTPDAETIEWAMLTSANLSTQAWGSMPKHGEVRISSYEVGVVVWPAMLHAHAETVMVPTFRQDLPDPAVHIGDVSPTVIGLRIPYSLALKPYCKDDQPWIAAAAYNEPDSHGSVQRW